MRYLDNGLGDALDQAVFAWLKEVLKEDVIGLRWQSGYFDRSVLWEFAPTLERLAAGGQRAAVVVGSNDGETLGSAVDDLVAVLGLPREEAFLGVVRCRGGLFHPKTIHLELADGRQLAYVGSANLTSRGIDGRNIEAGVLLDTADDDSAVLDEISRAVDAWAERGPESGVFAVARADDVQPLVERGILARQRPPRSTGGETGAGSDLPRRSRRHILKPPPGTGESRSARGSVQVAPGLEGDVLLAHLAGPGRWGQAAFPEWFIANFFKVRPDTGEVLTLHAVAPTGDVTQEPPRTCGYKAGSKNWYYELGLAAVKGAYPGGTDKPIGVFHRIAHQTFRYAILMPGEEGHNLVADLLEESRSLLKRPANELPRAIVHADELADAWPDTWFFGG